MRVGCAKDKADQAPQSLNSLTATMVGSTGRRVVGAPEFQRGLSTGIVPDPTVDQNGHPRLRDGKRTSEVGVLIDRCDASGTSMTQCHCSR